MMTMTIFALITIAAAPLLRLRRMQLAMQGTLGSLCLAAGCGAFFAMTSNALAVGAQAEEGVNTLPDDEVSRRDEIDRKALITSPRPRANRSTLIKSPEGAELHTQPQVIPGEVIIPPGRPEWVGRNIMVGSEHSVAVCSGPFSTEAEANRELDKVLKQKTDEYIAEQLGSSLAPQLIRFDVVKIKKPKKEQGLGLVKPENLYHEQISVSIGPMHQVHALLEFDPDFRKQITDKWRDLTAYYRLLQTGLVAGGALLFLGTVFSYFRLDTATRGYYTVRLQFMTAAAILAIVGAGALLARWIYWL